MTVQDMHYDIKFKLNKIDSQQYRNLRIPEIDWVLNEACETFIKELAFPRVNTGVRFEINQRITEDLQPLVVTEEELIPTSLDDKVYTITLPERYSFFISAYALGTRLNCGDRRLSCTPQQHNETFQEDTFISPSFEWREVPVTFSNNKMRIYTDDTFEISKIFLNYIKKHPYIHNAENFLPTESYTLPSGTVLTTFQSCELPPHTHREIVNIAVDILLNNLNRKTNSNNN